MAFLLKDSVLSFSTLQLKATKISWDGLEADAEETTWVGTGDHYRRFVPTLKSAGEVTVEGFWNPSLALPWHVVAPFSLAWANPATTTWGAADAFLKKATVKLEKGKPATISAVLKLSGPPDFDASGEEMPELTYPEVTLAGLVFAFTPAGGPAFSARLTAMEIEIEVGEEEVTSNQSAESFKEFVPTLAQWTSKVDGYFDPAAAPPIGRAGELVYTFATTPAKKWGGPAICKGPKPDGETAAVVKDSIGFQGAGPLDFDHA